MSSEPMTAEQARQLVEADKQQRASVAAKAVQDVLVAHQCDLVAIPQIVDGRIVAVVQIVAR